MLIPADASTLTLDSVLVVAPNAREAARVAAFVLPGAAPAEWRAVDPEAFFAPSAILMVDARYALVRVLDATPATHPYHVDRDDLQALSDALHRPVQLHVPEAP